LFSSPSFDVAIEEILSPLVSGGTLCLAPDEPWDPATLLTLVEELRLTEVSVPTAFWHLWAQECVRRGRPPGLAVERVVVGGEALSPEIARLWCRSAWGTVRLLNGYGPTEAVISSTVLDVTPAAAEAALGAAMPLGPALAGRIVRILDPRGLPVPAGVAGELCMGGTLARGYLGRPGLTAERFVPDAGEPGGARNLLGEPCGARLYRTGDLARWTREGGLEFLGRLDQQVKIRGLRIELGEIESALVAYPAVREAAVVTAPDRVGGLRLVAFVVADAPAPAPSELRAFLGARLPGYMVPTAIGNLAALPLTAHGKVDRAALGVLAGDLGWTAGEGRAALLTPMEELAAGIWAEALGLAPEAGGAGARIGPDDDFFELGGHSLLATRVLSRVRATLGVEIPVLRLFEAPTLGGFAAALGDALAAAAGEEGRGPAAPPLAAVERAGPPPLSFAQERLWFLHQLQPGSPDYNMPAALRLAGDLDVAALQATFAAVVRRHEAVRTTFAVRGGQPVQVIPPASAANLPPLPVADLAALPTAAAEAELRRLIAAEATRPFDLAAGPLLRLLLVRLGPAEHALTLTLHHIVADGWSVGVLVHEIGAFYSAFAAGAPALEPVLPELPIQYADFAVWQRGWLQGEVLETQLGYWRQRLAGAPTFTPLPFDRPRRPLAGVRGRSLGVVLEPALLRELRALCRREGVTVYMVLLAGLAGLLHRMAGRIAGPPGRLDGEGDVVVGSPFAGRNRRELEDLIGFFINTLVLRTDLSGGADGDLTGTELLARVRESTLGAYAHQDLPFEKLVAELALERDLSHAPLFQVMLALENTPEGELQLPGLTLTFLEQDFTPAKFDLTLNLSETGEQLKGLWLYNAELFDGATVVRLSSYLQTLLAALAGDPAASLAEIALLAPAERHQLQVEGRAARAAIVQADRACLHERFAAVAAERPEEIAVVCGAASWTYGELAARAHDLAWRLDGLGIRPGERVGIFLDRSLDLVAAVLAVLETGAAYVPVDPAYPAERVAFVLADSGVRAVVSQRDLEVRLPGLPDGVEIVWVKEEGKGVARPGATPLLGRAVPRSPAYVIYTSGSTGKPKGVEVSHAHVARLFDSTQEWFGFGPEDVWTLFHSIAFDFSVWELWGALLHGGRLVVVPYEVSRSPESFYELLCREKVTVLNQTPSAFRQLIWAEESVLARGEAQALALREVVFGGEALEPGSLASWVERHGAERPRLVNMYGITETTVHVTYRPLSAGEIVSGAGSMVGVPIPDLAVYLVDRGLQPVPLGVPGEILVGGAGVAQGYLGRPDLTAERFVPDPFSQEPGMRLYRSGDLARRRPPYPDKDLEYLGRIDTQVKIRGFRIELGEIESALAALPGVREAVVVVRQDSGEPRLVAYVTGLDQALPRLAEARELLGRRLPDYMLPSALVALPALPLTAHGKVDRAALPAPSVPAGTSRTAPRTALERDLAALFGQVLRVEAVGLQDDFFALGGSSISGAVLINRLQEKVGEIVHVVAIFDAPTVERLAAYLAAQHREAVRRVWGAESLGDLSEGAPDEVEAGKAGRIDETAVARLRALIPRPARPTRSRRKNPRAVFVLSPPRSGSTLLRVMLGGHPELFAPPELELLGFDTLAERREAFASARDAFWLEGAVRAVMAARGCGAEEARTAIEEAELEGLSTLDFYRRLQGWIPGRTLVDKTPSYALSREVLERAEAGFEAPFYIHLLRHPLGMVRSFEEAKLDQIFFRQASDRSHGFSRRQLAELIWVVSEENIRNFLAGVPAGRQHRVVFEELVRDPEGVLGGLCVALGLDYHPAMARPYESGVAASRMTDGLHAASRMLGDVKFHQHGRVDAVVAERWRDVAGGQELGEVTRRLAGALGYEVDLDAAGSSGLRITPGSSEPGRPAPLSFAQERLWFLDRLAPGSPMYNIPVGLRLAGRLDAAALERSLEGVVRRHASLRTTFVEAEGRPGQVVSPVAVFRLPGVDLSGLPAGRREAELRSLATAEARRPFDLARGPLLRAVLLQL
ncbi:MAG TPA: amino acid adenylation domain-containing protein, partial [Thermoanaerobaculia bacterium]|nr:amino acid adenylation domain-containing protein [Thermoanaerobaculia bacterium]